MLQLRMGNWFRICSCLWTCYPRSKTHIPVGSRCVRRLERHLLGWWTRADRTNDRCRFNRGSCSPGDDIFHQQVNPSTFLWFRLSLDSWLSFRRRRQPCFPSLKNLLKYISVAIILCCVVNVIATVSIPIYMNTSPGAMARVFNTSMMLYSDVTWHKVTIDRIQFSLQCCGHTEYSDWIAFDWQVKEN